MKQGWEIKRIVDVAEKIFAGGDKPKLFSETETDILRVPVYANGVTNNGLCGYTDKCTVEQKCITISARGTIGFCCIRDTPFVPIVRLITIIPSKDVDLKYLYYAIGNSTISNSGTSIPQLTVPMIREILIPVPPIAEQQRIVEMLDREFEKIDALKANAERNLQYAKDLYAKLTVHILTPQEGWSTSNLKSICKKIGSGATPSGGKQSYTDKGIHLIRSMNVHNNCFRYNELAHINDVQAKQLDNVTIERGDVLFNITGASVTRCCLVPVDVIPARVNQHVSILRVDDNIILPKYLVYTLISSRYNIPLMQMAEDGATRQAITKKQLEDFNISYPNTIKEQLNIISFLDKLSEQCTALGENYTKTIALCDDMKQALLRQAFNGEL